MNNFNEDWFNKCKEFIEKYPDCYLVRILNDKNGMSISDKDTLLRLNGYNGVLLLDDSKFHYFLMDIDKKMMISVNEDTIDYFIKEVKERYVDFLDYIDLHIIKYGVFCKIFSTSCNDGSTKVCILGPNLNMKKN